MRGVSRRLMRRLARKRRGRITDGCLRVDVDVPAWASQVRWQQGELFAKIAALIPESTITEIAPRGRPRS